MAMETVPSLIERRKTGARIATAKSVFKEAGFDIDVQGDSLSVDRPEKKPFPVIIFSISIIKDMLDIMDLTIILMIVTKFLSILMGVAIFVWLTFNFQGKFWKKRGLKVLAKIWARYFGSSILEMVPILGILPLNSWFILWAHNQNSELVRAFEKALSVVTRFK